MTQQPALERGAAQLPYFYLLTTMAFFGSAFASSKFLVGEMPHEIAAVLRFGLGAIVLLAMLPFVRGSATFTIRDAVRAGAVGLVGVFAYNFFFFWGLSLAPSLDGSIIVPVISPILTTLFLVLVGREAAGAARMAGLLLGVAGAAIFLVGAGTAGGFSGPRLLGDGIFLLGAVSWAAYSILSKKLLTGMEPLRATACGTAAGAVALLLVAAPAFGRADFGAVSGTGWLNVVYLAVGPTAIAYLFYYRGLRAVSPSTATIFMFAVPVFGAFFSVVLLGETLSAVQLVGAVVMIVGAVLAVTRGRFRSGVRVVPQRPTEIGPVNVKRSESLPTRDHSDLDVKDSRRSVT